MNDDTRGGAAVAPSGKIRGIESPSPRPGAKRAWTTPLYPNHGNRADPRRYRLQTVLC